MSSCECACTFAFGSAGSGGRYDCRTGGVPEVAMVRLPPQHACAAAGACRRSHRTFRSYVYVPFAVEWRGSFGRVGLKSESELGCVASASNRIPEGACLRWAMQLLTLRCRRATRRYTIGPGWCSLGSMASVVTCDWMSRFCPTKFCWACERVTATSV